MTSILQPHSDVSMRPSSDKELEGLDLDDLFSQYLETDLLQLSDNVGDPSSSDDLAHLFEHPSSNGSDPIETSPMPNWDATSDEAWRKALGNIKPTASPTFPDNSFSIYPESRGKASLSDPSLFLLDDLFETTKASPRLSHSTPSTPKPSGVRLNHKFGSSIDRSLRHPDSTGIRKSTHSSTVSPSKMMRQSHFRADHHDICKRTEPTVDAMDLQLPPNILPSSPPLSGKLPQTEHSSGFYPGASSYPMMMSPLHTTDGSTNNNDINTSNYQMTPLSSPALEANPRSSTNNNAFNFASDTIATAFITNQLGNAALTALQTPPPTHRLPTTSWGPDTPASLDFSFPPTSPEFQTPQKQPHHQSLWGTTSSAGAIAAPPQPSPSSSSTYRTTSQSSHSTNPTTHHHHNHPATRNPSQNLTLSTASVTASVTGLGISCDSSAFNSFADLQGPPHTHNGFSASSDATLPGFYPTTPYSNAMQSTHSLNHRHHSNGRTNAAAAASSRSPSPSPPPTNHPRLRRTTGRPGVSGLSSTRQASSHSQSHSHRRKSSQGGSSGAGSGARPAGVGFVNFTPDDSKKILTGVAPSGSSKTKARREKEAAEKRRKLSQAAVKAVLEAGGDVRSLEEEGLI